MVKLRWNVIIEGTDNGFIVSVGCKRFVTQDADELLEELGAYLRGKETKFYREHYKDSEPSLSTRNEPISNITYATVLKEQNVSGWREKNEKRQNNNTAYR